MKSLISKLTFAVVLASAVAQADDKVPLKIELPKPLFVGTPVPIKVPNLEPELKGKRPEFLAPAGTVNLAGGKTVTSSDKEPVIGTLDLVTDGDKAGDEGSWVELAPGNNGCRSISPRNRTSMPWWYGIIIHRPGFILTWWCRFPTIRHLKKGVTTIFNADAIMNSAWARARIVPTSKLTKAS